MKVKPYLMFDGRGEEAARFYEKSLGAKIENLCRYNECPPMEGWEAPAGFGEKLAHCCVTLPDCGGFSLADAPDGRKITNGIVLTLLCTSASEAEQRFAALSAGGSVSCPMVETFYADRYGECTDPFGVAWAVMFEGVKGND